MAEAQEGQRHDLPADLLRAGFLTESPSRKAGDEDGVVRMLAPFLVVKIFEKLRWLGSANVSPPWSGGERLVSVETPPSPRCLLFPAD